MLMTQPTFKELLTSQEARDRVRPFRPVEGNGTHWMTPFGGIYCCKDGYGTFTDATVQAIWQGWLTDCAPPPEPRAISAVRYFNFYQSGQVSSFGWLSRKEADAHADRGDRRVSCKRFELEAMEGVFDD